MESEESVGMADDNMGPSTTAAARTPRKVLSPIPEMGASSRAPTPQRLRIRLLLELKRQPVQRGPGLLRRSRLPTLRVRSRYSRRGPTGQSGGSWPKLEGI
jgi:hypothetical protein